MATNQGLSTEFRVFGRSASEHLIASAAQYAAEATTRIGEVLPAYAAMPSADLEQVVTNTVLDLIFDFAEVLRTGRLPERSEFAHLAVSSRQRAESGVSLRDVLDAYSLGFRIPVEHLSAGLVPEMLPFAPQVLALLAQFSALVTNVVVDGYLDNGGADDAHASVEALAAALLDGQRPAQAAAGAGVLLPDRYAVLSIAVTVPDEGHPLERAGTRRRELRRLRRRFDTVGPGVLARDPDAGLVLVPIDGLDDAKALTWLRDLVTQVETSSSTTYLAAVALAPPADVPAAAVLAQEVLEVAQRSGRSAAVVCLDDVLLEYQFSRPSPALAALARLLDPLEKHPDKLETIRTFLEEGMSRKRVARRLHLHPNTVDYRLRTAAALIGLDPGDPADAQRILAAFTARAARLASPGS